MPTKGGLSDSSTFLVGGLCPGDFPDAGVGEAVIPAHTKSSNAVMQQMWILTFSFSSLGTSVILFRLLRLWALAAFAPLGLWHSDVMARAITCVNY